LETQNNIRVCARQIQDFHRLNNLPSYISTSFRCAVKLRLGGLFFVQIEITIGVDIVLLLPQTV
jgi:hypothetical protein